MRSSDRRQHGTFVQHCKLVITREMVEDEWLFEGHNIFAHRRAWAFVKQQFMTRNRLNGYDTTQGSDLTSELLRHRQHTTHVRQAFVSLVKELRRQARESGDGSA